MSSERARVLMVDADAVSRRMVERAIEGMPGWSVETAKDGTSALDILSGARFDVVISERNLPDMTGLLLHRRLMQETRLRSVPFIFLSIDDKIEHRVMALRAGGDDYLSKPIDPIELQARLESHVARSRRARAASRARRYQLAGELSALVLPDLVATLSLQERTGLVTINAAEAIGEVFFETGEVVHATFGNLSGPAAFAALFAITDGQFEFTLEEPGFFREARTIHDAVPHLLGETLKSRGQQSPVAVKAETKPISQAEVAKHPSKKLSSFFSAAIKDEFSLAQMFFWTGTELNAWTRKEFPERLHLHFITDLPAGMQTVLAMSSAAGERQLLSALQPVPKLAGLVYFLRNERLLDVVVIDIDNPLAEVHHLRRSPSITILAPKNGDPLEIGPRGKAGIKPLLLFRQPELVVGVGTAALEASLDPVIPASCRRHFLISAPGEDELEPRELISRAIEHWGTL
jgi:CheY-like chemotaxis protein